MPGCQHAIWFNGVWHNWVGFRFFVSKEYPAPPCPRWACFGNTRQSFPLTSIQSSANPNLCLFRKEHGLWTDGSLCGMRTIPISISWIPSANHGDDDKGGDNARENPQKELLPE